MYYDKEYFYKMYFDKMDNIIDMYYDEEEYKKERFKDVTK